MNDSSTGKATIDRDSQDGGWRQKGLPNGPDEISFSLSMRHDFN